MYERVWHLFLLLGLIITVLTSSIYHCYVVFFPSLYDSTLDEFENGGLNELQITSEGEKNRKRETYPAYSIILDRSSVAITHRNHTMSNISMRRIPNDGKWMENGF